MRRKLSLLALALVMSVAAACASPAGPARTEDEPPEDSSEFCTVVVGSQTRCGPY